MSRITDDEVWRLAVTTLDHNHRHNPDGSHHTVPSRTLYPHQWSGDTGFIAAGLARVRPDRAWAVCCR